MYSPPTQSNVYSLVQLVLHVLRDLYSSLCYANILHVPYTYTDGAIHEETEEKNVRKPKKNKTKQKTIVCTADGKKLYETRSHIIRVRPTLMSDTWHSQITKHPSF